MIPALKEFPDDNIVTFDDDILYPPNIIERLIKKHQKYPHAICGCRIRLITTKNGILEIMKYRSDVKDGDFFCTEANPNLET